MTKYFFGTGRRKSAIAQIRLSKGSGKILYSDGKLISNKLLIDTLNKPLEIVSEKGKYDISVKFSGGGFSSQREAGLLAASRALSKINEDFEKVLKKEGFLSRDSREKERKKPGLKRARRAPQWQKR